MNVLADEFRFAVRADPQMRFGQSERIAFNGLTHGEKYSLYGSILMVGEKFPTLQKFFENLANDFFDPNN